MRLCAVAAEEDRRLRGKLLCPITIGDASRLVVQKHDGVTGAPPIKVRRTLPFEIVWRGVEAVGSVGDLPQDQVFLLESAEAEGDVSIPPGDIEDARVVEQFDLDERMEAAKSGGDWHDDAVAQPVETRYGDGSLKAGVARGNAALDRQRALVHEIQSVGQCGAKLRRCEAILAALEQLDAGLAFKAGESSADRRLGRSKRSGRALSEPWRATARAILRSFQSMTEGVHGRFSIRPLYEIVWAGYENKGRAWTPDDLYQPKREAPVTARPEAPQTTERVSEMTQNARARDVNDLRFINPKGLYDPAPNGYSHLAVFPAGWRMILPAGQGGETEDQVLSDDFRTQLKQAVRNTEIVLAAAGAKLSDVAKFTLYVVHHDKEKFRIIQEEFGPIWGDRKPAWTLAPAPMTTKSRDPTASDRAVSLLSRSAALNTAHRRK
jgi:enamine deaminase RidA (YjgF/YER057c/UK114 family)